MILLTFLKVMETKILRLDKFIETGIISAEDLEKINEAASVLRDGGLVAFPTETVYGLGGDARRPDVSARIYAAKGRPSDNPLIVHISSMDELYPLVKTVPCDALRLSEAFWPGPMTMVMNKSELIPHETTGGLDTVAVRMPVHPVAKKLIELSGVPVAAPSANRSGRPSTTTAAHCIEDLSGRTDLILDGGPCDIGVESTIVDLTGEVTLLRPGAVTVEMLTEVLGREPLRDKAIAGPLKEGEKPKAPGMKYRHYAPSAPLTVVRLRDSSRDVREVYEAIYEMAALLTEDGKKVEVICTGECESFLRDRLSAAVIIRTFGNEGEEDEIAKNLFAVLRDTDSDRIDSIIAEGFGEKDLFLAIMNRLKKAAGWQMVEI